jgi:hypothetical protein
LALVTPANSAGLIEMNVVTSEWWIPSHAPDTYRVYRVEVRLDEPIAAGSASGEGKAMIEVCSKLDESANSALFSCQPKKIASSRKVSVTVPDDLTRGTASFKAKGQRFSVKVWDPAPGELAGMRRDLCKNGAAKAVAGQARNMQRQSGLAFGRTLKGGYSTYDHGWVETGTGVSGCL